MTDRNLFTPQCWAYLQLYRVLTKTVIPQRNLFTPQCWAYLQLYRVLTKTVIPQRNLFTPWCWAYLQLYRVLTKTVIPQRNLFTPWCWAYLQLYRVLTKRVIPQRNYVRNFPCQILPKSVTNMDVMSRKTFTPVSKLWAPATTFTKLVLARQFLVKNSSKEFHENPTNGLVGGTWSRADRQTDMVST